MSDKKELKKQISAIEADIADLEQKVLRSQTSIMASIVANEEPNKVDMEYFKTLSSLIKLQREKLQMLKAALAQNS